MERGLVPDLDGIIGSCERIRIPAENLSEEEPNEAPELEEV